MIIETLTDIEVSRLEKIYSLIINIRVRKFEAIVFGLLLSLVTIAGMLFLDMKGKKYNLPILDLLGVSLSSSKDLLWLLSSIAGLIFVYALLLFYLVFKPRNRLDALKLADILSRSETQEALRKLQSIRSLLATLPKQAGNVYWLENELFVSPDKFVAQSLAKG